MSNEGSSPEEQQQQLQLQQRISLLEAELTRRGQELAGTLRDLRVAQSQAKLVGDLQQALLKEATQREALEKKVAALESERAAWKASAKEQEHKDRMARLQHMLEHDDYSNAGFHGGGGGVGGASVVSSAAPMAGASPIGGVVSGPTPTVGGNHHIIIKSSNISSIGFGPGSHQLASPFTAAAPAASPPHEPASVFVELPPPTCEEEEIEQLVARAGDEVVADEKKAKLDEVEDAELMARFQRLLGKPTLATPPPAASNPR